MDDPIGTGVVIGTIIAVLMIVAFGILDAQCWGNSEGPRWDAQNQECRP